MDSDVAALSEALKPETIVDDIVQMLANPRQTRRMVRYASVGTGAPTLLFKPQNDFTLDYTAAVTDKQIPSREVMFILRRDPVCPLIYFQNNPSNLAWSYEWYSRENNNAQFPVGLGNNKLQVYNAHDTGVAGFSPHGTVEPAFKASSTPDRYIWVDHQGGTGIIFVQAADGAGAPVNVPAGKLVYFKVYQWDGSQDKYVGQQTIAAGTSGTNFSVPERGGYMRVEFFNGDDTGVIENCLVTSSGSCSTWCHPSINNVNNIAESISSERVITSTIKISNASAPGFAAGMIYEADVYNGQPWQTLDRGSQQVGALDSVQTRVAKNGYYGFCRVEGEDDFVMARNMSVCALANQGSNSQEIYADLDDDSPYKVVVFILPPPGTFPSDRFLNIELTTVIEAMGNTDLVEPEAPVATPAQWAAALLIFASIPSGYENPTHWRDILAAIGKVGTAVTPRIAEFLRGIQDGHPLVVAAAQAGGNFVLPLVNEGFKGLQALKRKKK